VSRLANFYGTAITQSGQCESQYDCANIEDSGYTYNDGGKHPMWAVGLNVRAARPSGRLRILSQGRPHHQESGVSDVLFMSTRPCYADADAHQRKAAGTNCARLNVNSAHNCLNMWKQGWMLPLRANPGQSTVQGTNQIVGIGDTGLDLQNCFFADSTQPNMPSGTGAGWGTDGIGAAPCLRKAWCLRRRRVAAAVGVTVSEGPSFCMR
jgi:hypothetical protein